jgi:hypothetical protein
MPLGIRMNHMSGVRLPLALLLAASLLVEAGSRGAGQVSASPLRGIAEGKVGKAGKKSASMSKSPRGDKLRSKSSVSRGESADKKRDASGRDKKRDASRGEEEEAADESASRAPKLTSGAPDLEERIRGANTAEQVGHVWCLHSSPIGCTSCIIKSVRSRRSFISSPRWTP